MLVLGGWISQSIMSVGIWIVSGVYHVATWAFELFLILATGSILDSSKYEIIVNNAYVILGVIMLFFLSFTLLKGMVNPDEQNAGTSVVKKVLVNLVTSGIILALLPTIFSFMFDFQTSIFSKNTLGIFFSNGGSSVETEDKILETKRSANKITNSVFTAFFNVIPSYCEDKGYSNLDSSTLESCQETVHSDKNKKFGTGDGKNDTSFKNAIKEVDKTGHFSYVYTKFVSSADDGDILDFNFLLSLIAGAVLVYVGVSFCIDMAVRLVKLVFYQLIAPIPIFMRVLPDTKFSGTFDSWLKVTLTCYAEVFVRVGTIYFAVYLCEQMIKSHFLTYDIWQYGFFMAIFAKAFILMGIIIFMRQLPKLLSEVTGIDSSNMKIGIKDKLKDAGVFTAGAAVGGGLTAGVRNAIKAGQDGKFNFRKNYRTARESGKSGFRSVLSSARSGILGTHSIIGGTGSGAVRGFRAGMSAGSFRDAASAAGSGARGATDARDKRESYKSSHGDTFFSIPKDEEGKRHLFTTTVDENGKKHHEFNATGSLSGHISDRLTRVKEWAGVGVDSETMSFYDTAFRESDEINSASEATYKKKQAYIDQQAKVKTLEASKKARQAQLEPDKNRIEQEMADLRLDFDPEQYKTELENLTAEQSGYASDSEEYKYIAQRIAHLTATSGAKMEKYAQLEKDLKDITEKRNAIEDEIEREKTILDNLQVKEAMKAKVAISTLATKLGKMQKDNYSVDKDLRNAYELALFGNGTKEHPGAFVESEIGFDVRNVKFDGKECKIGDRVLSDDEANIFKIYNAMMNGEQVDDNWITDKNIMLVQKVLDNTNNERRTVRGRKERENIVNSVNRGTNSNNSNNSK